MIKVQLVDARGTSSGGKVNGEGELNVVVHPHPPIDETIYSFPFRQYMTTDGTPAGSNDFRVDGSSAHVDFCILARQDVDVYITSLSVEISDASSTLNKFGNITALTNGLLFSWKTIDRGSVEIHEGLKSNYHFVRLSGGDPSFGDGNTVFRANNISGVSEGYIPFIDFKRIFGMPWGLRLRKGTLDKLVFTVRDNITAIDSMNVIGYGIQI
jgi:hypothetical protein